MEKWNRLVQKRKQFEMNRNICILAVFIVAYNAYMAAKSGAPPALVAVLAGLIVVVVFAGIFANKKALALGAEAAELAAELEAEAKLKAIEESLVEADEE